MSTQNGIMSVIKSTKLWTAPSKEQYLPIYMKEQCDTYADSPSARRVFPIEVSHFNKVHNSIKANTHIGMYIRIHGKIFNTIISRSYF